MMTKKSNVQFSCITRTPSFSAKKSVEKSAYYMVIASTFTEDNRLLGWLKSAVLVEVSSVG